MLCVEVTNDRRVRGPGMVNLKGRGAGGRRGEMDGMNRGVWDRVASGDLGLTVVQK
jgi:hypothetical protein